MVDRAIHRFHLMTNVFKKKIKTKFCKFSLEIFVSINWSIKLFFFIKDSITSSLADLFILNHQI